MVIPSEGNCITKDELELAKLERQLEELQSEIKAADAVMKGLEAQYLRAKNMRNDYATQIRGTEGKIKSLLGVGGAEAAQEAKKPRTLKEFFQRAKEKLASQETGEALTMVAAAKEPVPVATPIAAAQEAPHISVVPAVASFTGPILQASAQEKPAKSVSAAPEGNFIQVIPTPENLKIIQSIKQDNAGLSEDEFRINLALVGIRLEDLPARKPLETQAVWGKDPSLEEMHAKLIDGKELPLPRRSWARTKKGEVEIKEKPSESELLLARLLEENAPAKSDYLVGQDTHISDLLTALLEGEPPLSKSDMFEMGIHTPEAPKKRGDAQQQKQFAAPSSDFGDVVIVTIPNGSGKGEQVFSAEFNFAPLETRAAKTTTAAETRAVQKTPAAKEPQARDTAFSEDWKFARSVIQRCNLPKIIANGGARGKPQDAVHTVHLSSQKKPVLV